MALYTSNLASAYTLLGAKIPCSNIPMRRSNYLIVHPSFSIPCFVSSFSKHISPIRLSDLIRATAPQKYVYPDPNPQFADAEIRKFRAELLQKLTKDKEEFGEDLDNVINVCAELFSEFLHKEYGGPGTLLVEPFTDIFVVLKERKLPGAPMAARASLLWAQNNVDQDWDLWNSK